MIIGAVVEFKAPGRATQRGRIFSALDDAVAIRLSQRADAIAGDRATFSISYERGLVRLRGEIVQVQGTIIVVEFLPEPLAEAPVAPRPAAAKAPLKAPPGRMPPRVEEPDPEPGPPPETAPRESRLPGQDLGEYWIGRRRASQL